MWLPAPIYNRLPQFWLVAGVLFMVSAIYFGFGYRWSIYYFGVGVVACVWSVGILVARSRRDEQADDGQNVGDDRDPQAE